MMKFKTPEEYRLEQLAMRTPEQVEADRKAAEAAAEAQKKREAERLRRELESQQIRRLVYYQRHSEEMFLKHNQDLCYDPEGKITSQEIYEIYSLWCRKEEITPKSSRSFLLYLKEHAGELRLIPINGMANSAGRRVRGFRGIRAVEPEFSDSPPPAADAAQEK